MEILRKISRDVNIPVPFGPEIEINYLRYRVTRNEVNRMAFSVLNFYVRVIPQPVVIGRRESSATDTHRFVCLIIDDQISAGYILLMIVCVVVGGRGYMPRFGDIFDFYPVIDDLRSVYRIIYPVHSAKLDSVSPALAFKVVKEIFPCVWRNIVSRSYRIDI